MVFFVTIMYNAVKGVKNLKHLLLVFFFTLFLVNPVYALYETNHENEYFKITLPNLWEIQQDLNNSWLIFSYDSSYRIRIIQLPKDSQSLDEYVDSYKQKSTQSNRITLKEDHTFQLNNRRTRMLVYCFDFPRILNEYFIFYTVDSDKYRYNITAEGPYETLNSDRETIDAIVNSLEILK